MIVVVYMSYYVVVLSNLISYNQSCMYKNDFKIYKVILSRDLLNAKREGILRFEVNLVYNIRETGC